MENKNQVFFLHFAGGSSSSYNFLSKFIRNAEVHQLELPGRGNRFAEPFVPDIEAAIEDYTRQIINRLNNRSFAVFGHSMGALIAIHVIKRLERLHHFSKRLIVSGNSGPGIKHEHSQKRYLMDTDDFLSELRKIGGMPAAFFQHQGLINHFSPIIKSDFKIIEEQEKTILGPVNTPIFAIIGNREFQSSIKSRLIS